jgi:hypothetical protein
LSKDSTSSVSSSECVIAFGLEGIVFATTDLTGEKLKPHFVQKFGFSYA